jgi:glutamyl-Q tRNA(Asp) synthetase
VASYVDARAAKGQWLVRIEDIDTPRCVPGATDAILRALEAYALEWDEPVLHQSSRLGAYRAALDRLKADDHVFGCVCTRRDLSESGLYPGTCRNGLPPGASPRAWRLRVPAEPITYLDRLQGTRTESLTETSGDFVLLRADGIFAYQLAVVVDDAHQNISDVVRGADLLDSTARQIHLQRVLSYATPSYLHIPVVVDEKGEKLSKQTLAAPIPLDEPKPALHRALAFLGHTPPAGLSKKDMLRWAAANWNLARIPTQPRTSP